MKACVKSLQTSILWTTKRIIFHFNIDDDVYVGVLDKVKAPINAWILCAIGNGNQQYNLMMKVYTSHSNKRLWRCNHNIDLPTHCIKFDGVKRWPFQCWVLKWIPTHRWTVHMYTTVSLQYTISWHDSFNMFRVRSAHLLPLKIEFQNKVLPCRLPTY